MGRKETLRSEATSSNRGSDPCKPNGFISFTAKTAAKRVLDSIRGPHICIWQSLAYFVWQMRSSSRTRLRAADFNWVGHRQPSPQVSVYQRREIGDSHESHQDRRCCWYTTWCKGAAFDSASRKQKEGSGPMPRIAALRFVSPRAGGPTHTSLGQRPRDSQAIPNGITPRSRQGPTHTSLGHNAQGIRQSPESARAESPPHKSQY